MADQKLSREKETEEIIQSLADITIKSVKENENAIAKKGIDKIIEIGTVFLEEKSKNESKFFVSSSVFYQPQINQHIFYISNEIERIFEIAIKTGNKIISNYLILNLSKIVDLTMKGKNNFPIVEQLVETRGYFGSLYWKLMKIGLENKSDIVRNRLQHHLISIPQFAILDDRYHLEYVDSFINNHVYRVMKLIIDFDDFRTFQQLIDDLITSMMFAEPDAVASEIENDLWLEEFYGYNNAELSKMREELQFLITHNCLMDLNKINEFIEKLEIFKEKIFENLRRDNDQGRLNQKFSEIYKNLRSFRICFQLFAVLYRIASYAIYQKKPDYIKEIWYHIKPEDTSTVNNPIVPSNYNWPILYFMYSGIGHNPHEELDDFGFFESSQNYKELYLSLFLLKINKIHSLPSEDDIKKWSSSDAQYRIDYYYDLIYNYPIQKIKESLLKLREKYNEFFNIIKEFEGKDPQNVEKKLTEKLIKFETMKKSVLDTIISYSPISNSQLEEYQKAIKTAYEENTISKYFANLNFRTKEETWESILFDQDHERHPFVTHDFIATSFSLTYFSSFAHEESKRILKLLQTGIEGVKEETEDYIGQIEHAVSVVLEKGFKPDIIFLPLDIKSEIRLHNWKYYDNFGKLKFENGVTLKIIHSWNEFPFDDIILFDSKQFSISYETESMKDRIKMEITNIEKGNSLIHIKSEMFLKMKILDANAFYKIYNPAIEKLKKQN